MRVATSIFGHVQGDVRFDCGWLFVSLERGIDRALELAQEVETKEHSQKSRLGVARSAIAEIIL